MTQEEMLRVVRDHKTLYFILPDYDGLDNGEFSVQVVEDGVEGILITKETLEWKLKTTMSDDYPMDRYPRYTRFEEACSVLRGMATSMRGDERILK